MRKEKIYNRHHRLAKSKGGSNHKDNIVRMEIGRHNALHYLFQNKKIAGKILELFEIEGPALNENLKKEIVDVLEKYIGNYYNQYCIKGNKYNKSDEIGDLLRYNQKNGKNRV